VYKYWVIRRYYEKQGVKVVKFTYPFFGSLIPIINGVIKAKDPNDNVYIVAKIARENLDSDHKRTLIVFGPNEAYVHISDPKIVQELYTTNNKYFDKHPIVRDVTMRLLGNSILFADTNMEWRKRRTAFSPAFYKGKLVQLVEISKECMRKTQIRWKAITGGSQRRRFDFQEEMQIMSGRILLSCALGEDISELEIPYRFKGRVEMRQINFVLL
jgi:cytochrome P450